MTFGDVAKLGELIMLFTVVGGFLAWEWWRTQQSIKKDKQADDNAERKLDGCQHAPPQVKLIALAVPACTSFA